MATIRPLGKYGPADQGWGRELQSEEAAVAAAADVVIWRLLEKKEENTSGQRATKVPMQIKISHGPANTLAKVKRINGEIKTRERAMAMVWQLSTLSSSS